VLDLDTYPQKFRDQFTKAGATDAAATEIKQITVQGHHGIDFRISFTAKDGRGRHAVWLLRVVHDGVFFVVAQTIDFDTNVAAVLPGVRATQARLVAGLKLV